MQHHRPRVLGGPLGNASALTTANVAVRRLDHRRGLLSEPITSATFTSVGAAPTPPAPHRFSEESFSCGFRSQRCGVPTHEQRAWLASVYKEHSSRHPKAHRYLSRVYSAVGDDAWWSLVDPRGIGFFWNSVSHRASFAVSWMCSSCERMDAGLLWAPLEDAQFNPRTVRRYRGAAACRRDDSPCLFRVAQSEFDVSALSFPGFFVRAFDSVESQKQLKEASAEHMRLGVPEFRWVEVMRISRLDVMHPSHTTTATVGQVWFWVAPGSGIWLNVGRSLVRSDAAASAELWKVPGARPCETWAARGYDTIQMVSFRNGFSLELLECRGATLANAHESWEPACPPAHVELLAGIPAAAERYAPALRRLPAAQANSIACSCDRRHSYLNCASKTRLHRDADASSHLGRSFKSSAASAEGCNAIRKPPACSSIAAPDSPLDAFAAALKSSGVFAVSVSSIVVSEPWHKSFVELLRQAMTWFQPGKNNTPIVSASYVSDRLPNTFCASPMPSGTKCGAQDLLLLFRAEESLWQVARQVTLHDACGFSSVSADGTRQPIADPADFRCPSSREVMRNLCTRGHDRFRARDDRRDRFLNQAIRATHGLAGRCGVPAAAEPLERAAIAFRSACTHDVPPHHVPTCQLTGVNFDHAKQCSPDGSDDCFLGGLLNTEIQFAAVQRSVLRAFERAFVAVGVVTVAGARSAHGKAVAAASAARRCRAHRIASQLSVEYRKRVPAWEFEMVAAGGSANSTRVLVPSYVLPFGAQPGWADFGGLRVPPAPSWGYTLRRDGFAAPWRRIGCSRP